MVRMDCSVVWASGWSVGKKRGRASGEKSKSDRR